MRPKKTFILGAALVVLTATITTVGYAADPKAKSKSKRLARPSPGPGWLDTNHDGQLSEEEFERAKQMLEEKIKKAEIGTTKAAASATPTR